MIAWVKGGLVPLSAVLADESRLVISQGDIYQRFANLPAEQFDLILIDVDHSPDDRLDEQVHDTNANFYTVSGLRAARWHLTTGGVLAVWSYAESGPFAEALGKVFGEVKIQPITYDNELVDEKPTDWLFFARGSA